MINNRSANYCVSTNQNKSVSDKMIPQTLFLGASVMGYNANCGWGNQPSQLTVNLTNDNVATGCSPSQFSTASAILNQDNSYYSVDNTGLYVYSNGTPATNWTDGAMLPGKVYYDTSFNSSYQVIQKWWTNKDPGFLGDNNNINLNGTVDQSSPVNFINQGYNIIGCPVYFKMADFSFGGVIQSWKRDKGSSGNKYTVIVESMQSVLNKCYVILDSFGGAISGRRSAFGWSAPGNYVGNLLDYNTTDVAFGAIPNVFNVYGFLESWGPGFFGGSSYKPEEGLLSTEIITALRILTGADNLHQRANSLHSDFGYKTAFSPYGRIITRAVSNDNGQLYTSNLWGVISPTPVVTNVSTLSNKCQFSLDLSDLEIENTDFRIKAPYLSISDLLDQICESNGLDWTTTLINTSLGWVIKVLFVSKRKQPMIRGIQSTISKLTCENYGVSSLSYGKERNDFNNRALLIGGPQQRLYQAKSYRLAYTQSNYIFDPYNKRFVDYYSMGHLSHNAATVSNCADNSATRVSLNGSVYNRGKIKFPAFFSTRNPVLDDRLASLKNDEIVKTNIESLAFNDEDTDWEDSEIRTTSISKTRSGNYKYPRILTHTIDERFGIAPCPDINVTTTNSTFSTQGGSPVPQMSGKRYIPIYRDVICPFFGYLLEDRFNVNASNNNTDFKRIRPVWYDAWTGQICILCHVKELPETRIKLNGRYNNISLRRSSTVAYPKPSVSRSAAPAAGTTPSPTPQPTVTSTTQALTAPYDYEWFILTESEIRAAMAGNDKFLSYSLAKLYKTDLYIMLNDAYINRQIQIYVAKGWDPVEAVKAAYKENEWTWGFLRENFADFSGNLAEPNSDSMESLYSLSAEARKDWDIIAEFVRNLGNTYYGKQYMVMAPNLYSATTQESYNFKLQTGFGDIFVFKGGGEKRYSYEPCSADDGAWEEYGNMIDDTIEVGDKNWYSLSNDKGQIKPIVGYNASNAFDYFRWQLANVTTNQLQKARDNHNVNPYFNYDSWEIVDNLKTGTPDANDFYYDSLNIGDFASDIGSFVMTTGLANSLVMSRININQTPAPQPPASPTPLLHYDAFGIPHGTGSVVKKLYKTCDVEKKFSFLDPEKLLDPRMIVKTSMIRLNASSEEFQNDPSNTVSANIGMEDLAIYTRTGGRNQDVINLLLNFFQPYFDINEEFMKGTFKENNVTAKNIGMHPKCAHPFFAGIPIRSNLYNYGPWTNYPNNENYADIFSTGTKTSITNVDQSYNSCTSEFMSLPDSITGTRIIENWIGECKIETDKDLTPWNYGGMNALDLVASGMVSGMVNYQADIETGTVDIVGTPIFNIGGAFSYNSRNESLAFAIEYDRFTYTEVKEGSIFPTFSPNINNLTDIMAEILDPGYTEGTIVFDVPSIKLKDAVNQRIDPKYYSNHPILTNIITDVGSNGISTTYQFRTYTRKISLFNKQDSDRIRKFNKELTDRRKETSQLQQRIDNMTFIDKLKILEGRFGKSDNNDLTLGTSPGTTLVLSATPFIPALEGFDGVPKWSIQSSPQHIRTPTENVTYSRIETNDPGGSGSLVGGFNQQNNTTQIPFFSFDHRINVDAKIYKDSEIGDSLRQSWSRLSVMSLDGIFSPISFYPTIGNDTFSISKYDTKLCPICGGDKKRPIARKNYKTSQVDTNAVYQNEEFCDACCRPYEKINATTEFNTYTQSINGEWFPPYIISSGNDDYELSKFNNYIFQQNRKDKTKRLAPSVNVPINLTTLQPIVMPYYEFRNCNAQNYTGNHPDGAHDILTINGTTIEREFIDRARHSISIIGRGSVFPAMNGPALKLYNNLNKEKHISKDEEKKTNLDYYYLDERLKEATHKDGFYENKKWEQNVRFVGFRGPMMLHGWGYDTEGYPVPNAADEPLNYDSLGRPLRFARLRSVSSTPVKYEDLAKGQAFSLSANGDNETFKLQDLKTQNSIYEYRGYQDTDLTNETSVYPIEYKDDYANVAGYDPAGYQGSIVSKTQKFISGAGWTPKIKLKEFYLHWAERPDTWPVGPIDLRWDAARKVWTANTPKIYKMVHVTLEEDLTKEDYLDETFPARGFLDDTEYRVKNIDDTARKMVFVKDRTGYTAPRGARLLCRYDADTGFYEPVSKPVFVTTGGLIPGSNNATLTLSYVPGIKKGQDPPTMIVSYNNPLGFSSSGGIGIFTYMNGKWTLTSVNS